MYVYSMKRHPPKYGSTPHWPWSQTVHKDDRYHVEPEVFTGREVVITEKLDGGNTCLWQGEVYARSTGQPATQGWFAMVKKHHAWKTASTSPDQYIYGEDLYGLHSIAYEPIKEDETYRVFNVREGDTWLKWDRVEQVATSLSLPTVPVLFRGTFDSIRDITSFFEEEINNPSSLGGPKEGFVIRQADEFDHGDFAKYVCKYVRKNHVQTDEHWTRNWQIAAIDRS